MPVVRSYFISRRMADSGVGGGVRVGWVEEASTSNQKSIFHMSDWRLPALLMLNDTFPHD